MRALLVLLALLAYPATAAAAQADCARLSPPASAQATMAGMAQGPCCPHPGAAETAKTNCAGACAAMCSAVFISPAQGVGRALASQPADLVGQPDSLKRPFAFAALDPPPRSFG
ncbi:MAG TPA: hypothetical protein VII63_03970 [Caulobacteraceae bacterium]